MHRFGEVRSDAGAGEDDELRGVGDEFSVPVLESAQKVGASVRQAGRGLVATKPSKAGRVGETPIPGLQRAVELVVQ